MGISLISNPPYNMKWQLPPLASTQSRFADYDLPPESNSNYAFILTALDWIDDRAALLLPNGVLTSENKQEKEIRKKLIKNNLLEAVIALPDNMFVSTSIPTCILLFNKNKNHENVQMIDLRKSYIEVQRQQNGQFGGNSHEKRTYIKIFKELTVETMDKAIDSINNQTDISEFSKSVTISDIESNEYIITPSRYIVFDEQKPKHRDFQEIAYNINYITRMKNSCKLVINETVARSLNMDIEFFKNTKKSSLEMRQQMKKIGIELEADDCVQFTKNKNELEFKCNDKELLPNIQVQFLIVWTNQIAMLNTMQNKYLAELRDALLPDLMSGKIDLGKIELN